MKKKQHLKIGKMKPLERKISEKYKTIYEIMGKFKDTMPSSEDFLKRKLEDKLLDK